MREANKGIESEISRDDCEEIWNGFEMCLLQSQASINTMVNSSSNWLRKLSVVLLKMIHCTDFSILLVEVVVV